MRLTMIVLLFAIMLVLLVNPANAERWNWKNAQAQPFTSINNYVIAVGKKVKIDMSERSLVKHKHIPEVVQASKILEALKAGKEIRLMDVKIEGNIEFHGDIKQNIAKVGTADSEYAKCLESKGAIQSVEKKTRDTDLSFSCLGSCLYLLNILCCLHH